MLPGAGAGGERPKPPPGVPRPPRPPRSPPSPDRRGSPANCGPRRGGSPTNELKFVDARLDAAQAQALTRTYDPHALAHALATPTPRSSRVGGRCPPRGRAPHSTAGAPRPPRPPRPRPPLPDPDARRHADGGLQSRSPRPTPQMMRSASRRAPLLACGGPVAASGPPALATWAAEPRGESPPPPPPPLPQRPTRPSPLRTDACGPHNTPHPARERTPEALGWRAGPPGSWPQRRGSRARPPSQLRRLARPANECVRAEPAASPPSSRGESGGALGTAAVAPEMAQLEQSFASRADALLAELNHELSLLEC